MSVNDLTGFTTEISAPFVRTVQKIGELIDFIHVEMARESLFGPNVCRVMALVWHECLMLT